jgi:hypothetical protein
MKRLSTVAAAALCALLLLSLCLHTAARLAPAAQPISIDPADSPLVIEARLDEKTTSFTRNVRLTATAADVAELVLLASDLTRVGDPETRVERAQVTIPAGVSLKRNQPRDVTVTVAGVRLPGVYKGNLKFLSSGRPAAEATPVEVELRVTATPDVKATATSFLLVRCVVMRCEVTDAVLPRALNGAERVLPLANETLGPVDVRGKELTLRGEKTGRLFTAADVAVEVEPVMQTGADVPVTLTFDRAKLPPDRYNGTLRLRLKGADAPLPVAFTLDVRDGPWWALVVIVAGIIVGRIASHMTSPEAQREDAFLRRYYRLKARAEGLADEVAHAHVRGLLDEFLAKLEGGDATDEVLKQALDKVETQTDFFAALFEIKRKLEALGLSVLAGTVAPKLLAARDAMIGGKTEDADKLRKEVEETLRAAAQDTPMGVHEGELNDLLTISREATIRAVRVGRVGTPTGRPGGRLNWLARLLAFASGGRILGARMRYWLLRPLFYLLLLLLLSVVGLQSLYINSGATFGSAGFYDYLGLFLWGLSADVAQRTLQSLQKG